MSLDVDAVHIAEDLLHKLRSGSFPTANDFMHKLSAWTTTGPEFRQAVIDALFERGLHQVHTQCAEDVVKLLLP